MGIIIIFLKIIIVPCVLTHQQSVSILYCIKEDILFRETIYEEEIFYEFHNMCSTCDSILHKNLGIPSPTLYDWLALL